MIKLVIGDITKYKCDAIVNAANNTLLGGGGVDGCIHRAAGKELFDACRKLNGCETGSAKVTPSFGLKDNCKYIIHAVGPDYRTTYKCEDVMSCLYYRSVSRKELADAYKSVFANAEQLSLKSIALPSISTGIYAFPLKEAAEIALREGKAFLRSHPDVTLTWVLFDDDTFAAYEEVKKILEETENA